MIQTHLCRAWCAHPRHVDLVHASRSFDDGEVAAAVVRDYAEVGVRVVVELIEDATETPASPEPRAPDQPARPARVVWWRQVSTED